MFTALNACASLDRSDLSSLRFCNSGGAPLPGDISERFRRVTGQTVLEGWGMTEMCGVGTIAAGALAPDWWRGFRDPYLDRRQAAAAGADRAAGGRGGGPHQVRNIDKDNFLLIVAPVDGVITDVTSTQPGDKLQANTPLSGIAPKGARPVLKAEIAESDRGFLREKLAVKLNTNPKS